MKTPRPSFTLLETILALSVSAIIMFGCCIMAFNMMNVVENLSRGWSLKNHADGVERFLRGAITSSLMLYPNRVKEVFAEYPSKTLMLSVPPESNVSNEYYLTFGVDGAHPLFVSPTGFSPAKICWLYIEDNNLSLIWRHANAEFENSDAGVYKTLLSPFVEELIYIYDDETGWTEESEIDSTDSQKLPRYIKIIFSRNDEKTERIISLSGLLDPSFAQ